MQRENAPICIFWRRMQRISVASAISLIIGDPAFAQATATGPGDAPDPVPVSELTTGSVQDPQRGGGATPAVPPASIRAQADVRLNRTGRTLDLVVPLRDRSPLGQVAIRVAPDDSVRVSIEDIANALSRAVTPEFATRLRSLESPDGFASPDQFAQIGLDIAFNPAAIELVATLDPDARVLQGLGLGFNVTADPPEPDRSEPFAAFIAYQFSLDYVHEGNDVGLQSPRVDFDVDGRLFNLVGFENEFTYDGNEEREFQRFGSRLIYDQPDWAIRFAAGDLLPAPVAFQEAVDVLGVGASRLLSTFRSDRILTASAGRTIQLREAATVTLVVNDVPIRVLRLAPGSYDLSDLPLTTGANRVQLLVEDDAGGQRVVSFDFFQDFSLLAPGVDEFDIRAGIRSDFLDGLRQYFEGDPIVTGFYRRGITSQLTLGGNLQATDDTQVIGLDGTLGTRLGLFTMQSAFSNRQDVGTGFAARLQYRHSTPLEQNRGERRLDAAVEYRSVDFSGIQGFQTNDTNWRLSARYSQPVSEALEVNVGVDYAGSRSGRERYGGRAGITWRLARNASLNAFAGYENREGFAFGFSLIYRPGRNTTATAQYDSISDQAILTYTRAPLRRIDSFNIAAQLTRSPGNVALSGDVGYSTNRGDFQLSHRAAYSTTSNDIVSQVTSLRASGALAFAGGRLAIGRYLSDSFAIISRHSSLNGADVIIGSRIEETAPGVQVGDAVIARTDFLGPALVPIGSYNRQNIFFSVPNAPVGYDLGAGNFQIYPWLHSGFDLQVGSEFNTTIIGTLLDASGTPVALTTGTAQRLNDPNSPTVSIFTNRVGRLAASGLAPGRWRISANGLVYEFVIEETPESYVNLRELRPIGRQEN